PLPCGIGGRAGKFGIPGGEPALSGEAELVDHDGGFGAVERVSGPRRDCGCLELLAIAVVLAPRIAERAESDGKPAGLAGEMTAETEGVSPLPEQCVGAGESFGEKRPSAQLEAGLPQALEVAIR